jgi:hypothetical protein
MPGFPSHSIHPVPDGAAKHYADSHTGPKRYHAKGVHPHDLTLAQKTLRQSGNIRVILDLNINSQCSL